MFKRIGIVAAVIAVLVGGFAFLSSKANDSNKYLDQSEEMYDATEVSLAATDISAACPGGPSTANVSEIREKVRVLLDAHRAKPDDEDVRTALQNGAENLRNCGLDDQAERLERAADG